MRMTTIFRRLLDVTRMLVRSVEFSQGELIVEVRPRWRRPRCGRCSRKAPGYDQRRIRRWRSLNFGATRVWLEYAPRRVECKRCGVVTEEVPWARLSSHFTRDFEEMTAYLAQTTDKTTVSRLMGIAWATVGKIVGRVVAERLDPGRLKGLCRIGVDDFSYRKRHRYLTLVLDHDSKCVVWAAKGRSAETLKKFFEELTDGEREKIECVTIDMAAGYIKAIKEALPNAQIIFDRFHVQRLASDALDEVRREQLRKLRGTSKGRELLRSRFPLLKNPWNLTHADDEKLSVIQRTNAPLYRGYLLKEGLALALDYKQPARARRSLEEWLAWASRSRLEPFVRLARTIRKHFEGIIAYVKYRLTNGVVEGTNNRLRVIARMAFGFHSPEPLIAMLFLCCGGITLYPPLPGLSLNSILNHPLVI